MKSREDNYEDSTVIPDIGLMVAAYIITRMVALLTATPSSKGFGLTLVRSFAVITIIVAVVVATDLALRGSTATPLTGLR